MGSDSAWSSLGWDFDNCTILPQWTHGGKFDVAASVENVEIL